jgi:hypothetical protein
MDAKTRGLFALAAGSLFLAGFAWAVDDAVFGGVFFAFGVVAALGIAWEHRR